MVWTPKTLTPRRSSSCTVVNRQVLRGEGGGREQWVKLLSWLKFSFILSLYFEMQTPMETVILMNRKWKRCSPKR